MGQGVKNSSTVCRTPPGPRKDLHWHLKPRTIMAVGLTFMLTTTGLAFYLIQPIPFGGFIPHSGKEPTVYTPHGSITIDGDANFAATALLEGWPGDGSPGNPFIITGLEIDLAGGIGNCITINNTRVSFIISSCNITGAEDFGIYLENVTSGELVSNTCSNNRVGIQLFLSESITVAKNNCSGNECGINLFASNGEVVNNACNNNEGGIHLFHVSYSTIANNTCNNNGGGIGLDASQFNTVTNNTCNNNNGTGIYVGTSNPTQSNDNTISGNTCNYNRIGIYASDLYQTNIVADNTCLGNTEHDIFGDYITEMAGNGADGTGEDGTEEFDHIGFLFVGFSGIIILGAVWRMLLEIRRND